MQDHEYWKIGNRLCTEGLVSGNFGNMSIRAQDGCYITPSGSFLDQPGTLIHVPFQGEVSAEASSEYRVHLEIYRTTRYDAVVHAHPPFAIAAAFSFDEIFPEDSEGQMLCPRIPVVEGKCGSSALASQVAEKMAGAPVVIARGHGTFAGGRTLEEAYLRTSAVEHSSRILYYRGGFGGRIR